MAGGFWAGFGDELTSRIKEREQFIRDETAKRQDYLLRVGVPARMRMNQQMQEEVNTIRQAQELGFSERTAVALWQAGQLGAAMERVNEGNVPQDYFETVVTWASDQAGDTLTAQDAVSRAFGAANQVDLSTDEGRRRGFFEAMFALNPQGAVEENMSSFNVAGMNQNDLLAAAGFSGPQMTPVEGATYNPTAGYSMDRIEQNAFSKLFRPTLAQYYKNGFDMTVTTADGILALANGDLGRQVLDLETAARDAYSRMRRFGMDGNSRGLTHEEAMQMVDLTFRTGIVDDVSQFQETLNMYQKLGTRDNDMLPTGMDPVATPPEVEVTPLGPVSDEEFDTMMERISGVNGITGTGREDQTLFETETAGDVPEESILSDEEQVVKLIESTPAEDQDRLFDELLKKEEERLKALGYSANRIRNMRAAFITRLRELMNGEEPNTTTRTATSTGRSPTTSVGGFASGVDIQD